MKKFSLPVILLICLSSCAYIQSFNNKPTEIDSLDKGVKIDIKKFFSGELEGFSITQDQSGKIISTKTTKINGKWEENKGVVQQNFLFADSKKDSRTWLITLHEDGTFDAVGHDVVSPGKGKQVNNAAQMNYSLSLPGKIGKEELKYEDKIYLVDEKSAIMISTFKKGHSPAGKTITSLKKLNVKSD